MQPVLTAFSLQPKQPELLTNHQPKGGKQPLIGFGPNAETTGPSRARGCLYRAGVDGGKRGTRYLAAFAGPSLRESR